MDRFGRRRDWSAWRGVPKARDFDSFDPDDDPFRDDTHHSRWLLTTCIAAVAGTVLTGGTLMGLFSDPGSGRSALASVHPAVLWDPASAPKQDLDGAAVDAAAGTGSPSELLVTVSAPAGGASGRYPGISGDALPYRTTPAVQGAFRVASLDPGNITTIAKTPPPEPVVTTVTIAADESLAERLVGLGVTAETARQLVESIDPVFPTGLFKPGQDFTVTLDRQRDFYGDEVTYPVRLSFSPGPQETIVVDAELDGEFVARVQGQAEGVRSRYVSAPHYLARGTIESSLYGTAIDEGVPPYIIAQLMQVFSFDVDFQREIQPGDSFEAFYGTPLAGSSSGRKVLHYASLTLRGKTKTYYRFTAPDDGSTAYYDDNGHSASRFLMRTPASGARMTSKYGPRKHPLLGYTRMHTGIDFGLPYGTPIKAAGAGVVAQAGRSGGYGITVKIKHPKNYQTLYAHMSKIASGVKPGTKVNQGQVIGYVGSTGRSTGPHLHYEVRVNDKPVNPLKVQAAGGRQLSGEMMETFKKHQRTVLALMERAPASTQLAQAE